MDLMRPVWDEWNAKSPEDQAHDGLAADGEYLAALESLNAQQRADWQLDLFGENRDFLNLLTMRVGEHSVHTWDVVVALDPSASLFPTPSTSSSTPSNRSPGGSANHWISSWSSQWRPTVRAATLC